MKRYSVYLIGNPEHFIYKIGISSNVKARLLDFRGFPFSLSILAQYELRIDDPVLLRRTALAIENALHKTFKATHLRGEWFKDVDREKFLQHAADYESVFLEGTQ